MDCIDSSRYLEMATESKPADFDFDTSWRRSTNYDAIIISSITSTNDKSAHTKSDSDRMRAEKQKGSFFSFVFVSWCLMWKITWINISNARKHWEKYLPNTTSCACWNETFCQNHHLSAPQDLSTHVKGKEKMCNFLSDLSSQFSVPVENFRSQSVPIFPIRPPVEKFMSNLSASLGGKGRS